jgi:threonine dehydratase
VNHPTEPGANHQLVSLAEIREAATRIRGVALRTPLLPFADNAWIKPESLQPTGSFKIRGAYNTLAGLSDERRAAGVVTHSSGNHAQAVARAARLLGIRAVVVMPQNAPQVKIAGVRTDDAEVVFVGPANEERVARAHEIAERDGMELVPSADDRRVIAGQGTCGLEIAEQLAEMDVRPPLTVLVPIGLGGLAAGTATAVKALLPGSTVLGVEPALAADTRESLEKGQRVRWPIEEVGRTMADGLRAESPAPLPFAHLQRLLDGILTVTEDDIAQAVRVAASSVRLVLEPSGAVPLAALLVQRDQLADGPAVVVASGGNIDRGRLAELLAAG